MTDRYDTSSNPEGQYQPGSNNTVLSNKLGVTDTDEMDNLEFDLLRKAQADILDIVQIDQQLSSQDLCGWHQRWLGSVYEWAGGYRSVNMEKDGFIFAASYLIPKLMDDFDKQYLSCYTPCSELSDQALIEALAVCHVEFIIIHPFREGNGRLGRLLAMIMALQANKPSLNFDYMVKYKKDYILAIHAGHGGNYEPMKQVFEQVLKASEQTD
ncbi:hypothetical protein AB835_14800 [Candidatus Endobugula sertula]|uniref:Fido domain-containing protein n=1 Tax=Candidatus Endobugula sertula TaxID=62101 RepID=A0A1D2QL80_9GAMM|nr:hypothetical protein AB835_14800 [Candidatus Endobugula sertula]